MDVTVRGRNRDIPQAVRTVAAEKVTRLARHLDGLDHADIHFSEERNPRITEREVCEVTLRGRRHLIRAKATAGDAQTAIERVIAKLEHQIERAKRRRVRKPKAATVTDGQSGDVDDEGAAGEVSIVRTKQFDTKPMTPEEAVMQMELVAHDFYFFTNADTGRAAVVYRRDDGQFGLIDAT